MASYDLIVLGSGPGGYVAAIRAAQLGLKTAIVEKRATLGGTCLNVGCIPSKALLESSELFARATHEASTHGIAITSLTLDVAKMLSRKDKAVKKLTAGVATLMKTNGIDVHTGVGWVEGPTSVAVRDETGATRETLECKHLLLATGSEPIELPFLPFDGDRVVSSTEALSFPQVPEHLMIVGAGVIGLELGSIWARLGANVTMVEILPNILSGWDSGVAKTMQRELGKQGIEFMLQTKVTGANVKGGKVTLHATAKDGSEVTLDGDRLLVAVGRRPYTEGANIESLGLAMDGARIAVDERFATSTAGVWAIGDIVPGPMLAHKAEEEGMAAAENIAGGHGHVDYHTVPNVVYTWPEAAAVGWTEDRLKADGRAYRKGSFPFGANGRAIAIGATFGNVTILADAVSDEVLGAHIVGPWAGDLLAEIVTVMEFGGSAEDIARTVHSHPTLTEAVKEAALGVDGRMIHAKNEAKGRK